MLRVYAYVALALRLIPTNQRYERLFQLAAGTIPIECVQVSPRARTLVVVIKESVTLFVVRFPVQKHKSLLSQGQIPRSRS